MVFKYYCLILTIHTVVQTKINMNHITFAHQDLYSLIKMGGFFCCLICNVYPGISKSRFSMYSLIAKISGSKSIRYRSDAKLWDWYLIDVDPNAFAIWAGIPNDKCIHWTTDRLPLYQYLQHWCIHYVEVIQVTCGQDCLQSRLSSPSRAVSVCHANQLTGVHKRLKNAYRPDIQHRAQ